LSEGVIQAKFERAKFSDRFWAYVADMFIINVPIRLLHLMIATFAIEVNLLNRVLFYYDLIIPIVAYFWYFAYYAYKNNGQTLGKRWYKIRIAKLDGSHPTLAHFIFRIIVKDGIAAIIASLSFGGYGYFIWLATYLLALTRERRALHDIIAKTQVIKDI